MNGLESASTIHTGAYNFHYNVMFTEKYIVVNGSSFKHFMELITDIRASVYD